jgi:hypothetical protein
VGLQLNGLGPLEQGYADRYGEDGGEVSERYHDYCNRRRAVSVDGTADPNRAFGRPIILCSHYLHLEVWRCSTISGLRSNEAAH